ncbi:hypothetical protein XELAEV_18018460mg [Xenopus laevis]|uniref:Uncharacterized protein n=1 Tax=Xenopus laevis TaxID=8355 RepID=A0A974DFQ8_XENLA|nr:hypothetical protein XELAEV_18018460mg [Xenopus laevis]
MRDSPVQFYPVFQPYRVPSVSQNPTEFNGFGMKVLSPECALSLQQAQSHFTLMFLCFMPHTQVPVAASRLCTDSCYLKHIH